MAVRLVTGRTHRARAHLGSVGLPIIGDRVYGSTHAYTYAVPTQDLPPDGDQLNAPTPNRERISLHATVLRFDNPTSGEPLQLFLPPPADFWPPEVELWRLIRSRRR